MPRSGYGNSYQNRRMDLAEDRLDREERLGRLKPKVVSNFYVVEDPASHGGQVAFSIWSLQGVDSFLVLRNTSKDQGSAKAIATFTTGSLQQTPQKFPITETVTDADVLIAGQVVYYWIKIVPSSAKHGAQFIGPLTLDLSADPGPPNAIVDFAVSHDALSGGKVAVSVNVKRPIGDSRYGSVKIYVTGYLGIAGKVAIAQNRNDAFVFNLQQTGETVTFTAIAVSNVGAEAASGPTANLTLGATATVPAKMMNCSALELGTTGVQISWPTSSEGNLTNYLVFRGPKSGGFGAAAQIGTVAPSGAAVYFFLDATGLQGSFEWYMLAQNAAGNSAASDAIQSNAMNTSADLPPNSITNSTNNAKVDSIDNGTNATIRVYGAGGTPGSTPFVRTTGAGGVQSTANIPAANLVGFAYSTTYYVLYQLGVGYTVLTSYPSIMPDNLLWSGKLTTVAAGGGGGISGGGGIDGGGGGGGHFLK